MNARELEIDLGHLRLSARAWGAADAATRVLALHGWLDNAASFDALAPRLAGVELVALDLPGHGRSGHRAPGAWYHYVDYLGEVLRAADALGWSRFTLLGHSLGGAIASVLAAAAPERVEQLWLIEALGPISTPAEQSLELLRRALADRGTISDKPLRVFATLDAAVAARRQATTTLSERAARTLVERGTRAADGGFVWSSDPRLTLTSAIRMTEPQILACLAGIACPTLLVLADPPPAFLPRELMQRRIDAVAGIECVRVAGTHHLHLEDPQRVADAIAAFRTRPRTAD
jgi:pimeloyl-ACP methyl ester carboxylesterase